MTFTHLFLQKREKEEKAWQNCEKTQKGVHQHLGTNVINKWQGSGIYADSSKNSVIWFFIYSVLWIRSSNPAWLLIHRFPLFWWKKMFWNRERLAIGGSKYPYYLKLIFLITFGTHIFTVWIRISDIWIRLCRPKVT